MQSNAITCIDVTPSIKSVGASRAPTKIGFLFAIEVCYCKLKFGFCLVKEID